MARTTANRMTKKQQLINMLGGKAGADVATVSKKLGWQSHTTRAALSGLRKAGYELTAKRPAEGKPARYRITAAPTDGNNAAAEASAHAG